MLLCGSEMDLKRDADCVQTFWLGAAVGLPEVIDVEDALPTNVQQPGFSFCKHELCSNGEAEAVEGAKARVVEQFS